MAKFVDAEWLIHQCGIIGVTTGEMFIRLVNAAPSIEIDNENGGNEHEQTPNS